jgi:hypothetical protein
MLDMHIPIYHHLDVFITHFWYKRYLVSHRVTLDRNNIVIVTTLFVFTLFSQLKLIKCNHNIHKLLLNAFRRG